MIRMAVLVACIAAPAFGQIDVNTVTYRCDRGVGVSAAYMNDASGDSVVALTLEGRLVALRIDLSASGARYAWPSDAAGYVWWTKGDEATLYWREGAEETPLLTDCRKVD
jgi:membrane-bound inhibitor of C-type lysozyme